MHSRNGSMPPNLGAWLKQCLALLRRVFGSRKRLCSWLRRVLRRERSRDCGFRSCSRAAPASGKPQSTRYWPCPSSPVPSNTVVGRSTSQQTAVPIVHDFVTRRGYDGRGASDKDASYNVTLKPALTRLPLRELDGDPHLANAAQQVTPPPPRENAEALAKKFDEYKLETEFDGDVVVHTTGEWSPLSSSRSWTRSRWRKGEIVGAGGFGSVWLQEKMTEEEGGKRELRAVKMVPRMSLPEARKSQELYALVKLGGHDHLFVQFLGWYEDQQSIFFAMEYIEHGDLGTYIKTAPLKAEALEITKQILEGLKVLHSKEIYHRDLKPENILMASLDPLWVKIADFGTSKRAKNTYLRTQVGTPGYLAPELLGLQPSEQGKLIPYALDIWSLGCLVYKLLTSEMPFADRGSDVEFSHWTSGLETQLEAVSGTDMSALHDYCHGKIPFPSKDLQMDNDEIAFVKSLLAGNPKDRPTATHALKDPWLMRSQYISNWFENLKHEFSLLGVVDLSIGNICARDVFRQDIERFLPLSVKQPEAFSSLAVEAAARGYNTAIFKLLDSSCYGSASKESQLNINIFRRAAEGRHHDTMKQLLRRKSDFGAGVYDNPRFDLHQAFRVAQNIFFANR